MILYYNIYKDPFSQIPGSVRLWSPCISFYDSSLLSLPSPLAVISPSRPSTYVTQKVSRIVQAMRFTVYRRLAQTSINSLFLRTLNCLWAGWFSTLSVEFQKVNICEKSDIFFVSKRTHEITFFTCIILILIFCFTILAYFLSRLVIHVTFVLEIWHQPPRNANNVGTLDLRNANLHWSVGLYVLLPIVLHITWTVLHFICDVKTFGVVLFVTKPQVAAKGYPVYVTQSG